MPTPTVEELKSRIVKRASQTELELEIAQIKLDQRLKTESFVKRFRRPTRARVNRDRKTGELRQTPFAGIPAKRGAHGD